MPDPISTALIEAVSGDYEVFGELGRRDDGVIVFLARTIVARTLVALVLTPGTAGTEEEYSLDVLDKLDARVPESPQECSQCHSMLRPWARFCVRCGHDASGLSASGSLGPDELRSLAERAAGDRYELLGELPRSGGGGAVYFGRNRQTGKVAALRLELGGNERVGVSTMQTLRTIDAPREASPADGAPSRPPVARVSVVMNAAASIEPETGDDAPLATRQKPRHTLTGNEPSSGLSRHDALAVLGLDAAATDGEIRRRYQDLYSEYRVRETNAPTAALRVKYQSSLASIETAGLVLEVA